MHFNQLQNRILSKTVSVGVIGLGYIGLPISLEFALKGFDVIGFDIDEQKIRALNNGNTYIKHIKAEKIKEAEKNNRFISTSDFTRLSEVDVIIVCVPTPLDEHRGPDLQYIINTAKEIRKYLRKGQLISLESTTYPGTTEEVVLPILQQGPVVQFKIKNEKLKSEEEYSFNHTSLSAGSCEQPCIEKFVVGEDFFLAYSPEREDPNNLEYSTAEVPKVVSGVTDKCKELACALYNQVFIKTISVNSTKTAEAAKLLENIYRSVNIALVNELKMVFDKMGIDIWEVIEAASTKPFGFSPFYPGPGLGGHCIPIDPFYLSWKAHEFDINTKFIELAGEINTFQPYYIVEKTVQALNKDRKSLNGSKILILGAAYKKDIDDLRESPTLKLIEIFSEKGADVDYNDPYILKLPKTRKYDFDMESVEISGHVLQGYDVIVISTDHSSYNYQFIAENSNLIIDTRNVFERNGIKRNNIVKG